MSLLFENILFRFLAHNYTYIYVCISHSYVATEPDKGRIMSGNLKASLTISISLCGSYDGFDPTT